MPRPPPSRFAPLLQWLAGIGIDALALLVRALPLRWLEPLGGLMGAILYRLDARGRRRATTNLRNTFRDGMSPEERQERVRALYGHLGRLVVEYLALLGRNDLRPFRRLVEPQNLEVVRDALKRYGRAIFVTCHGGNFELLAAYCCEEVTPLLAVVKPVDNPHLNRRFRALRDKLGVRVTEKFPALRSVMRELRDGGSVAIVCDQRRRRRGYIVRFFGRPAATVDTPAVLAIRYGIPVIPAFCWRSGRVLQYRAYVEEPILPDADAPREGEVQRITQAINDAIERFVRSHPEQWDWRQLRWKITPMMRKRSRKRPPSEPDAPPGGGAPLGIPGSPSTPDRQ